MSLTYPLGLVALAAIPLLILIYIIKNKYTEKTVSSTYLWELSEQFIKKRLPISRIAGIVSLILQIAAVILIAVSIAHPVFIIPRAAREYCFILDGSGSMNIVEDGSTRFEKGKQRIQKIIEGSYKGSAYSLIYAGQTTDMVFESYTDKERCLKLLDELEASSCVGDVNEAVGLAQSIFDVNPSTDIYLVTDKNFERTENLALVNIAKGGDNYAVSDISYVISDGKLTVSGNVISYESDATLNVELYLDGASQPALTKAVFTKRLAFTPIQLVVEDTIQIKSCRVVIANEDILKMDNEAIAYNVDYENSSRTLLVSDYPFYIQAGLLAAGNSQTDVVKPEDYVAMGGYDLYIFDSFTPDKMPEDGAVWFFNPRASIEGSNFKFQGDTYPSSSTEYSRSTSRVAEKLLGGATRRPFEMSKYVKVGLSGRFTTLVTIDGSPLIFAGTNSYGNREVVFAFDLHDSASFTLSVDFTILTANLLEYSFPAIIDGTSYYAGDVLEVNVIPGAESISILTPAGKLHYPDADVAISEFTLSEVGSYLITMTMKDGSMRTFNAFAALPKEERSPSASGDIAIVRGTAENNMRNGIYDDLTAFIIILAVIAVADFGVYSYEQYQLR